MANSNNTFLFLAYTLAWIVFMLYAWHVARRQAKLAKELEELKKRLPAKDESPAVKI